MLVASFAVSLAPCSSQAPPSLTLTDDSEDSIDPASAGVQRSPTKAPFDLCPSGEPLAHAPFFLAGLLWLHWCFALLSRRIPLPRSEPAGEQAAAISRAALLRCRGYRAAFAGFGAAMELVGVCPVLGQRWMLVSSILTFVLHLQLLFLHAFMFETATKETFLLSTFCL